MAWSRLYMRSLSAALSLFASAMFGQAALAQCKLGKLAELPVTMIGQRPVVSAQINGREASLTVDSGAFYSVITGASAEQYGLDIRAAPFGFMLSGVNGLADVEIGTAKDFTLAGVPFHRVQFLVGGSEIGAGTIGLLGQNVLRVGDVEYDLANGAIRLFRTENCGHAMLAYWAKPDQPFNVISIEDTTPLMPHTRGVVYVNGVRMEAMFDTGAAVSVLSLGAASRAGIKTDSPGVVASGRTGGFGSRTLQSWIAPLKSFKIGDEEIKNTRMQIAQLSLENSDILVGADFFLAHRVYVAARLHKLFLTYNGGPVFNLAAVPTAVSAGPAAKAVSGPAQASQAVAPSTPGAPTLPEVPAAVPSEEPTTAAGFSRRGDAYLSRRQVDKALADLNRAVELAPTEPNYLYQRARVQLAAKQRRAAMADLDAALKLKPDDLPALVLRGALRLAESDKTQALLDFDAAAKLAPKQDGIHGDLAHAYLSADRPDAAIEQFDLWIAEHPDDYKMSMARNGRCWARAQLGRDLNKALSDCNAAIRMQPGTAEFLDSRGLVYLRLGANDKAIADFDAALRIDPKIVWSLYGRGLARIKMGQATEGQADIAAAAAINPRIVEIAKQRGVTP
jgi:tetratricopeptide (TPR) repeat protein